MTIWVTCMLDVTCDVSIYGHTNCRGIGFPISEFWSTGVDRLERASCQTTYHHTIHPHASSTNFWLFTTSLLICANYRQLGLEKKKKSPLLKLLLFSCRNFLSYCHTSFASYSPFGSLKKEVTSVTGLSVLLLAKCFRSGDSPWFNFRWTAW